MKYVIQHNVKYTTVPTRGGKEYMLPNRKWDGAISKAKKFSSKQAAEEFAGDNCDFVLVEVK